MPVLLNDYLPLVIFIALSAVISGALLVAPFLRRLQGARRRKAFGL